MSLDPQTAALTSCLNDLLAHVYGRAERPNSWYLDIDLLIDKKLRSRIAAIFGEKARYFQSSDFGFFAVLYMVPGGELAISLYRDQSLAEHLLSHIVLDKGVKW